MIVVRVSRPKITTCIGMMLAGTLFAGCTPKKPALPQPPTTQHIDRWGTEAAIRRVKNLSRESENLAADDHQLPGVDAVDHSRIMQRILINDAEIRQLADPWLDDLDEILAGRPKTLH